MDPHDPTVPAWKRRPLSGEKAILDLFQKPAPRETATRTPSTHINMVAPNGTAQLLKERGIRTVTTQTTATQSGSSSGHRRSSGISDKWVIRILGLAFGIIAVGIQIWYWTNSKEEDHKFEIQKMKEQTQQMQLQLQAAQLGRALPQEAVTASSGSCQQLGSEGIQTISSGCFQFDNTDSGPRLLTVNTGGKFASIRSDRADKPYVIIKTEDGIGCTAGTGNECSRWISGSNRQLKVAIPQGQRLVINTNPL